MLKTIRDNRIFFILYALFIIVGAILIILYSKSESHLFINYYHAAWADVFFKYFTYLGDGIAIFLVPVALLFVSKRFAIQVFLAGALSGILAQLLKRQVFGPVLRPSAYFEELGQKLHYVDGVDLHGFFSFPSGHSSTAFALSLSLALITKSKKAQVLFFTLGLLVGFSRMYLSQHFFIDVYFGSIFGCVVALLVYKWLWSPKMLAKTKLDFPIV